MNFISDHLDDTEYFQSKTTKDTIYLHHTAGSHRPDWTIDSWNRDRTDTGNKVRVATAYVIGGISTRDLSSEFDGKIFEAFDPMYWAHHLGVKSKNNTFLNQKSVSIELCNYGPLTKSKDGRFFTYVKSEVPVDFVTELESPFRGHKYYHSYTESQIDSLRSLILHLSDKFEIDISKGLKKEIDKSLLRMPNNATVRERQIWLNRNGFTDSMDRKLIEDGVDGDRTKEAKARVGASPFELNHLAIGGYPGIWSHSNVRIDKTDIFPQPEIIRMLNSI